MEVSAKIGQVHDYDHATSRSGHLLSCLPSEDPHCVMIKRRDVAARSLGARLELREQFSQGEFPLGAARHAILAKLASNPTAWLFQKRELGGLALTFDHDG